MTTKELSDTILETMEQQTMTFEEEYPEIVEELGGIERPWKVKNESGRIHRLPANNRMAAE